VARSLNVRRGFIYWADLEIGRKRVLVVSWNALHGPLFPICALGTSNDRERAYPTYARIEPTAANGLTTTSYVLCHALIAVPESQLDVEPAGRLDAWEMREVDAALLRTLDLPGAVFPPAPNTDSA
jgi:mRNA-degrading endonuclease toxin of MazEF toxin-antitoxin module